MARGRRCRVSDRSRNVPALRATPVAPGSRCPEIPFPRLPSFRHACGCTSSNAFSDDTITWFLVLSLWMRRATLPLKYRTTWDEPLTRGGQCLVPRRAGYPWLRICASLSGGVDLCPQPDPRVTSLPSPRPRARERGSLPPNQARTPPPSSLPGPGLKVPHQGDGRVHPPATATWPVTSCLTRWAHTTVWLLAECLLSRVAHGPPGRLCGSWLLPQVFSAPPAPPFGPR